MLPVVRWLDEMKYRIELLDDPDFLAQNSFLSTGRMTGKHALTTPSDGSSIDQYIPLTEEEVRSFRSQFASQNTLKKEITQILTMNQHQREGGGALK